MKNHNQQFISHENAQTIETKVGRGKKIVIPIIDIRVTPNPYVRGEYLYIYKNDFLNLTGHQKHQIAQHRAMYVTTVLDPVPNRPLLMRAQLDDTTFLEYVNDSSLDQDIWHGAIILVKKAVRLVLIDKLPEAACETTFNSIVDAFEARGNRPVITYCSFD